LHQAAFTVAAVLSWIKPALTPHDCFHQHGIDLMFERDCSNETIVLLKPRRTHPFKQRVNRITRDQREVSEARSEC